MTLGLDDGFSLDKAVATTVARMAELTDAATLAMIEGGADTIRFLERVHYGHDPDVTYIMGLITGYAMARESQAT